MKKLLLFATLVLGAVSCMKDQSFDANVGGETDVVLSVALPSDVTRAMDNDSAKGAIGNINLAADYDIRYILEVFDASKTKAKRIEKFEDSNTSTTFELRLIPGRDYTFVVWADFVAQGSEAALHYNAEDLRNIEISGTQNAMDESRDAYTGTFFVEKFSSSSQIGFELKRPFAKLRVMTNDMNEIYSELVGATIEYTAATYQKYDALTKQSSELATVTKSVDYTNEAYLYDGEPREGEQTLFADYILGTQSGTVQFIMTVEDSVQALPAINFNTAIPVKANYLTTIYGPILTDYNQATVTINPVFENDGNFDKEPYYVEVWDGESVTEPEVETVVDEATGEEVEVVVIDQPSDLAWLAGFVNGTNDFANASIFATRAGNEPVNFELRANIDLANYPWTPIGTPENNFVGTFNGNGFSIGNLNIVVDEAKEGKAYMGLFGYAKNVTIKNLILANANVNVACLDIDHSQGHIAALVGSLEGNSTIENVTVRGDIKIYATEDANGASRVGVIAGGNSGYYKVTMKNVHVEANEGSYLRANNNAGALAGQLMGKNTFENCSSNIDVTVNKFFAGGLIGIAGDGDTYTNCHSTGNIAVVAGRENRHNDEYRVGGIAGGWSDGPKNVFTLVNCSYTGNISGKNTDGTVAEPLDYAGYVGRGYALANCAGSKVVVNGVSYIQKYNDQYGVYENENGYEYVADGLLKKEKEYIVISAKGLVALSDNGLKTGETVKLGADIDLTGVEFNGLNTFHPENGNTFDGQNYTVSNWTNNSGASDMGFIRNWVGTVKNVKFENCHLKTSGRSAIAAAKIYGNIENVTINNCSIVDSYWACGLVAGLYNAGNISNCVVTNSSVKSNGGTGAIVGVINESAGTRKVENCKVEGCTVNNTGAYGDTYSGALVCGMVNITNSTVEFNGCSYNNNTKEGKYVGDLYYGVDSDIVVKIDGAIVVSTSEALDAAIKAGETAILLKEGVYVIPNSAQKKTLVIKGLGEAANTKIATNNTTGSYEGCNYALDGSTVTFENISINTPSSVYIGYARCKATYKGCIFNGTYTLYDNSAFENCVFNVSGDVYNVWTWGAPVATFTGCTFNSDGKAMLLYGQANTKLTINDCVFNDNGGLADLKAAIEIGNDYNSSYELIVNNTVVNGYEINDKGINTGTTLWANKNSMGQDKLNVVVDGVDVY